MTGENPLRMYLFMRGDLGDVPVGKMMVQAGHAFAHCLVDAWHMYRGLVLDYCKDPEHQKITLRVTEAELIAVHGLAVNYDLPSHAQVDLAKTIFPEPIWTCLAVGPIHKYDAEHFLHTRRYPLY